MDAVRTDPGGGRRRAVSAAAARILAQTPPAAGGIRRSPHRAADRGAGPGGRSHGLPADRRSPHPAPAPGAAGGGVLHRLRGGGVLLDHPRRRSPDPADPGAGSPARLPGRPGRSARRLRSGDSRDAETGAATPRRSPRSQ